MAIADIEMSSCGKVALCLGYTLLKFGTNWLSFVENITFYYRMSIYHTVLGTYKFWHFGYYKAIIEWIQTNFFCFLISLISSFIFVNKLDDSDLQF